MEICSIMYYLDRVKFTMEYFSIVSKRYEANARVLSDIWQQFPRSNQTTNKANVS